jgi:protein phosphatase
MVFAGISDRGQRKAENEDAFLLDGQRGLFIVADGIGGMIDGALAAGVVIEQTHRALRAEILPSPGLAPPELALALALAEALGTANEALWQLKSGRSGATCLVIRVTGDSLYFAHAGDCKLYLYRHCGLTQLNREHSLVRRLVDGGHLTKAEARTSKYRNVVERALGIAETLEPESGRIALKKGDRVLLCSDGLLADICADEVGAILGEHAQVQRCCEALVDAANAAGGSDNITVVVVDI